MAIMFTHVASNWTFVFFLVEIPTYMKIGLNMDTTVRHIVKVLGFDNNDVYLKWTLYNTFTELRSVRAAVCGSVGVDDGLQRGVSIHH